MALDGHYCPSPRHPMWTIKVWATPELAAARDRWSERRQAAFHEIAADLLRVGIRAVQTRFLRTRRASLRHAEGEVSYFFRRDRYTPNTILITIFRIDFHLPDWDPPKPGASAPEPLEPLVVDATISDESYTIDYVEGVLPRPPRKDKGFDIRIIHANNRIVFRTVRSNGYCNMRSLRPPMPEDRDFDRDSSWTEISSLKWALMKSLQMPRPSSTIALGCGDPGNPCLSGETKENAIQYF